MGEKEKVLVQDKPGRLAQTARGFSISLALASGRVSVGGAQGGLAWVWTCMDSIGTIIHAGPRAGPSVWRDAMSIDVSL